MEAATSADWSPEFAPARSTSFMTAPPACTEDGRVVMRRASRGLTIQHDYLTGLMSG
jgi:hypothetical protein